AEGQRVGQFDIGRYIAIQCCQCCCANSTCSWRWWGAGGITCTRRAGCVQGKARIALQLELGALTPYQSKAGTFCGAEEGTDIGNECMVRTFDLRTAVSSR